MVRAETLFAESRFCRAVAYVAALEWLIVIWGDSKADIFMVTIAGVSALLLSHHKYWQGDETRGHFRQRIAQEEVERLFGGLKSCEAHGK